LRRHPQPVCDLPALQPASNRLAACMRTRSRRALARESTPPPCAYLTLQAYRAGKARTMAPPWHNNDGPSSLD
jgi:hypothetical protein